MADIKQIVVGTTTYNIEPYTDYVTLSTQQDNISGRKTFTGGMKMSGRYLNSGDDEGLIVGRASNSYAGVCLGDPGGIRSVFYLKPDNTAIWRYNPAGSTSYDISHPGKAGTIALTSDVTTAISGTANYIPKFTGANAIGNGWQIRNNTTGHLEWTAQTTDSGYIPTINKLAYWNGRYNDSSSNLQYCLNGYIIGTTFTSCAANGVPRFDGTGATKIKPSGVTISDSGVLTAQSFVTDIAGSLTTQFITHSSEDENLVIGNPTNGAYVEFVEDVMVGDLTIDKLGKIGGITKISIGTSANASGTGAVAIGHNSQATNYYSIATGYSADATATGTIAMGYNPTASQVYSIAMGYSAYSNGTGSVAIGALATGSQLASIGIGRSAQGSGTGAVSIGGYSAASGYVSTAYGYYARATATGAIAMGYYPTAAGQYSIAIGYSAKSYYSQSISIGPSASATGATTDSPSSIVIGSNAKSYTQSSGDSTYVYGQGNTIVGHKIIATGTGNVIVGVGGDTSSTSCYVKVTGHNNVALVRPIQPYDYVGGQSIITGPNSILIGSGSVSGGGILIRNRSITSATSYSHCGTYLGGLGNSSWTGSSYLVLGSPTTNYCYKTSSGSSWTSASDIRDKTDIESLTGGLEFLSKITPITYVDNSRTKYSEDQDITYDEKEHALGTKKGIRRIAGVSAQETYAAQQEIYGTDNYGAIVDWSRHDHPNEVEFDRYWVQYERFIPYLIDAVKTLNNKVKDLEEEIKKLKSS